MKTHDTAPNYWFQILFGMPTIGSFLFFFVWRHGKNLSCSIYFSVFAPLKTISLICMSRIAQKLSSAKHFATPVIFVTSCIILCFVPHLTKFHSVCVQFWSRKVLSFVSPARESVRQRVKKVWFDSPKKKPFHSGNLLDWLKNEVMDLKHPNTTNKHTYTYIHTHLHHYTIWLSLDAWITLTLTHTHLCPSDMPWKAPLALPWLQPFL